jgi:hypothetical protein
MILLVLAMIMPMRSSDPTGLIIPGEGVGPITLEMNGDDLLAAVGEECLSDITVQMGEGFTKEGTSVWEGTDRELTVLWNDPETPGIFEIRVTGSVWETAEGLHTGMTLSEVDSILGEFQLLGFAWDYEGFADLSDTDLLPGISMRFDAADLSDETCWTAMEAVMGDEWFSSRDPGMVAFNPVMEVITVNHGEL